MFLSLIPQRERAAQRDTELSAQSLYVPGLWAPGSMGTIGS